MANVLDGMVDQIWGQGARCGGAFPLSLTVTSVGKVQREIGSHWMQKTELRLRNEKTMSQVPALPFLLPQAGGPEQVPGEFWTHFPHLNEKWTGCSPSPSSHNILGDRLFLMVICLTASFALCLPALCLHPVPGHPQALLPFLTPPGHLLLRTLDWS